MTQLSRPSSSFDAMMPAITTKASLKKPAGATAQANGGAPVEAPATESNGEADAPKIHLPDPSLGREETTAAEAPSANGEGEGEGEPPKPKKKTRRGSRGGRRRRKSGTSAASPPSE